MTIEPTHSCFDDAIAYLEGRVKGKPELARSDRIVLVHGIGRFPDGPAARRAGERFAHAWVEADGLCWDAGILDGARVVWSATIAEYYANLRIETTTRYDCLAVWAENRRTGHYGPWEPAYQALCRAGGSHDTSGTPAVGEDARP